MKIYEKEYCMKCGNENPQDRAVCKCGGRSFVYGNKFAYTKENGVICSCGNNKFKKTLRLNMSPIYETTYVCDECGNAIGVQAYCESWA